MPPKPTEAEAIPAESDVQKPSGAGNSEVVIMLGDVVSDESKMTEV